MSQKVYVILYNYNNTNYSMIKVINTLDNAYKYICEQEREYTSHKLLNINHQNQIAELIDDDCCNICHFIKGKSYTNCSLMPYDNVSQYIIASMEIFYC